MVKVVASWNMGIINYTTLCLIYLMNCYMVQSQYSGTSENGLPYYGNLHNVDKSPRSRIV